jgi:glycosyltransferase involved in cell wall biosynthesis
VSGQATGKPRRPRVIYVSYDGAAEPLGQSQVVAYLERLAVDCDIELISFEKPGDERERVEEGLARAKIGWHPLTYHGRPAVASTALDVWRGARLIRELAAGIGQPLILHARSYVPALMALRASLGGRARFLFDIRGFWADERVDAGTWRRGGMLYRVAKRYERRFFAQADAVVTLTAASVPQIRSWMGSNGAPVEVIPTCVDLDRFRPNPPARRGPRVIWAGTVGPRYDFRAGVALARELGLPFTVLTREAEDARAALDGATDVDVRFVPSTEIPGELAAGDVGLSTMLPSFSKRASAPTRVGEYLAAGMPVAALAGVGDLDALLPEAGAGVVLPDSSAGSVESGAAELRALLRDPETPVRCRRLAEERFSLTDGVARYLELYKRLSGPEA